MLTRHWRAVDARKRITLHSRVKSSCAVRPIKSFSIDQGGSGAPLRIRFVGARCRWRNAIDALLR